MNDKIYVGNGKQINSWKIGISLCVSDIPKEWIKTGKNGKKYLSLNLCERKGGVDQYGNKFSLEINTWKPEAKKEDYSDTPF